MCCITAEPDHGVAHGGQVNHDGHAGEVLHDDATGRKRDFVVWCGGGPPVQESFDVCACYIDAIFETQEIFQQDLQRVGQAIHIVRFGQHVKAVELILPL